MEEDIKVLEELTERFEKEYPYCNIWGNEIQAIENLIKEYKELDKENTRQHELLGKIHEKYQKDYIPKSKVREKIEERFGILCMQLGSYERDNATSEQERIAGGINELRKLKKELLQEGDK